MAPRHAADGPTRTTDDERAAIRAAVGRLGQGEFREFVADLWAARGWTVERDGDLLRVRKGGDTATLRPAVGWRARVAAPDDAVLVTPAVGVGATVDGDDLVGMVRHAVDDRTARRLCRDHLGGEPDELRLPVRRRARRAAGRLRGLPVRRAGVAAAAVLVVAAGLVVALGGAGPFGAGTQGDDGAGTSPGTNGTAGANGAALAGAGATPTPTAAPQVAGVPGAGTDGITDPAALAAAHRDRLRELSYRETFTRTTTGEGLRRIRRETVTSADVRYVNRTRVTETGSTAAAVDRFYDGTDRYRARFENGSFVYDRRPGAGTPAARTAERLGRHLAAANTSYEGVTRTDGDRFFRFVGDGAPEGSAARNYTVEALVDPAGFVGRLSVSYERPAANGTRRVETTLRYDEVGSATVSPPLWFEREFGAAADR